MDNGQQKVRNHIGNAMTVALPMKMLRPVTMVRGSN